MKVAVMTFFARGDYFPSERLNGALDILSGANFSADKVIVVGCEEKENFIEEFNKLRQASVNIVVLNCQCNKFELTETIDGYDKFNHIFEDGESSAIFIDDNAKYKKYLSERFIPYLQNKYSVKYGKVVFRLFGASEEKISDTVSAIASEGCDVSFNVIGADLDYKVEIIYDDKSTKMDYDKAQKMFIDGLQEYIYAEYDVSLEQRLVDLLKLRHCVMSSAESFTGGNVARTIIGVPGASEVFYEGIVAYNSDVKSDRLGVERSTLAKYKPVSAQVAGEMLGGLISGGKVNVAVSTTGIAGPDSDDSNFPVGLCYIGVAFDGEINVYRYEFSGDRREVIEKGTKTALFLIIKTLKDI